MSDVTNGLAQDQQTEQSTESTSNESTQQQQAPETRYARNKRIAAEKLLAAQNAPVVSVEDFSHLKPSAIKSITLFDATEGKFSLNAVPVAGDYRFYIQRNDMCKTTKGGYYRSQITVGSASSTPEGLLQAISSGKVIRDRQFSPEEILGGAFARVWVTLCKHVDEDEVVTADFKGLIKKLQSNWTVIDNFSVGFLEGKITKLETIDSATGDITRTRLMPVLKGITIKSESLTDFMVD